MKKQLLAAALLIFGLAASAQLVEINSMQRADVPQGMIVSVPTISPDGSFVVVSDASGTGLTKLGVDGGAPVRVTNNASGYDVQISNDGNTVVFRQSTTGKNHLRYTSLNSVDLRSGKEKVLVKPSRKLNAGVAVNATGVSAVEKGKLQVKSLGNAKTTAAPVVSINYGHLEYTANGKTVTLDPQGRGSYLWPSLSPDGTKVVYYLAGRGCFVCNTDGSNPVALGMLRAAKWLGNDMVVGMNDVDNGEFVTSSAIVASDLKGNRQELTNETLIAMYPSVSADGKKIAFATAEGELFIINLK